MKSKILIFLLAYAIVGFLAYAGISIGNNTIYLTKWSDDSRAFYGFVIAMISPTIGLGVAFNGLIIKIIQQ